MSFKVESTYQFYPTKGAMLVIESGLTLKVI